MMVLIHCLLNNDDLYEQTDLPPDNFQALCSGPQSTLSGLISEIHETLVLHYGIGSARS